MKRSEFLRLLSGAAAALSLGPAAGLQRLFAEETTERKSLPRRELGSTGESLPILGLGGQHVGRAGSEKKARRLVEAALEEGIRFIDTAESYQSGRSERWLGASLRGVRKDVFLMTKTYSRGAESAKRHLEGSLKRLKTDRLDLWQLHSLQSPEDAESAFKKGGAMDFIIEMKRQGVVRFTGVTGHYDPDAHRRALELYDEGWEFDCMQIPLSLSDRFQKSFERQVLPGLVERGIGVIAMKTLAAGNLLRRGVCTVEECLRYALSLPCGLAVVGMEKEWMIRENAAIARRFKALSAEEKTELLARVKRFISPGTEPYKGIH